MIRMVLFLLKHLVAVYQDLLKLISYVVRKLTIYSNNVEITCKRNFRAFSSESNVCLCIVPCDIGEFSPNGNSECFLCNQGSYQSTPGASSCIPCPANYLTMDKGSTTEDDCIHQVETQFVLWMRVCF